MAALTGTAHRLAETRGSGRDRAPRGMIFSYS
jgi:hypothetical protein